MKTRVLSAAVTVLLLAACKQEEETSMVSFRNPTIEISTDDLSPIKVSMSVNPSASENSSIRMIVTGATYGDEFTTDPELVNGEIEVPVSSGAGSAQFEIIPNEEGILFDDVNMEFEIIAVGNGLETAEFAGRFLNFTIVNNKQMGVGLPYTETFDVCGISGSGQLPPEGWEQRVVAQNSVESGIWTCYTGQDAVAIQANAFNSQGFSGDDYAEVWMVSPLVSIDNPSAQLSFDIDRRFDAPIDANTLAYGIQVSTNYDGTNFESANWEPFQAGIDAMTANDPDSDNIENTGPLDFSIYYGQSASIAFIYRASDANFGATALRIGNVILE